jgi:outer membrane protein, heavy metal efflux system
VATAQAGLRRARQLYAATAVEVRAEARAAAIRLRAARERANYIRRVVLPLRQRIVEQSQLQYNAMQIGVFPLLQARQQQVQAAADYIRALRDYWLARAQVEQVVNGRLPRGGSAGAAATDAPITNNGSNGGGGH